jgi:hypothetical protein
VGLLADKPKDKVKSFMPKAPTSINPNYKFRRQSKVGSVEDLLEGADASIKPVGRASTASTFGAPPDGPPPEFDDEDIPPPPSDTVKGHRRKELLDDRIRKPKYSVRRVNQICKWINGLHIWATPLDIPGLQYSLMSIREHPDVNLSLYSCRSSSGDVLRSAARQAHASITPQ